MEQPHETSQAMIIDATMAGGPVPEARIQTSPVAAAADEDAMDVDSEDRIGMIRASQNFSRSARSLTKRVDIHTDRKTWRKLSIATTLISKGTSLLERLTRMRPTRR